MLLNVLHHRPTQRLVHIGLLITLLLTLLAPGLPVRAQAPAPEEAGAGGIVWRICESPPICFSSIEARQTWAEQNDCRFLEDICEGTPPEKDDKGAQADDRGFWGNLWDDIKDGLVYGYEFVKGLLAGLQQQISDLFHLITNMDEVVSGLIDLGKAFYDDPEGTLKALAQLLGQEAVDAITQSTRCGAYDLGKTIGEYVSPTVMLKLASRLQKYGGKIADAVHATRHDLGCASFGAGTLIHTPEGPRAIERITIGQRVLSRHARSYADQVQVVTDVFGRTAPSYRILQTEFDTFRVTDEHPLWVQGRGWTEARYVTDEDVIASYRGDVLVLRNEAVDKPLRVYNFSVANTPSYFVGEGAIWVHNAKCGAVPGGGLSAHEAAGGHLLARHVGQSESQLLNRLATDVNINAASSFTDRAIAEFAVSTALDANQSAIQSFLRGSSNRLVINYPLPSPIGISVSRGAVNAVPASNVRVVLQRDTSMSIGYRIVTGFPTP